MSQFDSFAAVIVEAIEDAGQSQRAIAQAIGCSQSILSKWRNGLAQPESPEIVQRVADWLGVDAADLRTCLDEWAPIAVLPVATQLALEAWAGDYVSRALEAQDRRHARALRDLRRHWEARLALLEAALGVPSPKQ